MAEKAKSGRRDQDFGHVLYTRVDGKLLRLVRREVEAEQKRNPGRTVSQADVVRALIYKGLGRGAKK